MLALERHRWVLNHLSARGSIRTAEVAEALDVTEETVRRDFEKLEHEGLLRRSHGGAVCLEPNRREAPLQERSGENIAAKQAIARAALARIKPGQTIYFDASTTVLQLALLLPDQSLTVVTNGLEIAMALGDKRDIECILLGGILRASSLSCTGWAAEKALEIYHVDEAFLSTRGLDAERGLSEASEATARLKHEVISRSGQVVLLADLSKAGIASSFFYARPADIDVWITNAAPPAHIADSLTRQGVRLEVAP